MSYTPAWERLSDAVERVMRAAGCSKDEAQTDIGQAIADRTVKFRGKLARHTTKRFTSPAILEGRDFELPSAIASTDLDWERSRPNKPWLVRRGAYPLPGYWDLEWIKVYGSDITNVVCLDGGQGVSVTPTSINNAAASKRRTRPSFERAKRAVDELYPQGVPEQTAVPNKTLCGHVVRKLQELGLETVSNETILRAAGRRR